MAKTSLAETSLRTHFAAARAERAAAASSAQIKADRFAVRSWQQARLAATHAALIDSEKYGPATTFFLTELYSTADLTQRDADIERVIRILAKFLPEKALHTLASALEMDALSERMDNQLAQQLRALQVSDKPLDINHESYGIAYRAMGEFDQRLRQIELTREIGLAVDKLSRMPLLRGLLKLMGGPAHASGVGGLHAFLERGYAAFAHMRGGQEFIDTIVTREREEHMHLAQLDQPRRKTASGPGSGYGATKS